MDCQKITRAHERAEHVAMKREGINVLRMRGYTSIFPEHYNCDLVAVRRTDKRNVVLGTEFERSSRNVARNVKRNADNGCDYTLVVASDQLVFESCLRKLQKNLSPELCANTFIITFESFISGKLPGRVAQTYLCSTFVQSEDPLCSSLFRLCSEKIDFVQENFVHEKRR